MKEDGAMINRRDENGLKQGVWKLYYASNPSKLLYIGTYENGKIHGLWEWYRHNGLTKMKGELKKEKQIGLWYEAKYDY
jgi:antitoxin component YwqK of YwqJK toxin-antitoxin module